MREKGREKMEKGNEKTIGICMQMKKIPYWTLTLCPEAIMA